MIPLLDAGAAEIAATLAITPSVNQWTLVVVAAQDEDVFVEDLKGAMQAFIGSAVDEVVAGAPLELIRLLVARPATPTIVRGLGAMSASDWRIVDGRRTWLTRTAPAVILLGEDAVGRPSMNAPNLWSWFGASAWRGRVGVYHLTEEQAESRLRSLRERYAMSDDEVRAAARAGALPRDPEFAEWLVLLGDGALLATEHET